MVFTCEGCHYLTKRRDNYNRQLKSKLHLNRLNEKQPIKRKSLKKYICNYCNLYLRDSNDVTRHKNSNKHCKQNAQRSQDEILKINNPTPEQIKNIRQTIQKNGISKLEKPVEYSSKTQSNTQEYSEDDNQHKFEIDTTEQQRYKKKETKQQQFNFEQFKHYNFLHENEMKELINYFVSFIKQKNKNI